MWENFPFVNAVAELNSTNPNPALVTAIRWLLRPVVQLLIHYQVTYPYLAQLLKSLYLEVAEQDFPVAGKRLTDSRLSLLTGVHRKDVRRLRYEGESSKPQAAPASLGAQVISAWLSLPGYCNELGSPLPLYRLARQGEPSFDTLVEKVGKQDLRSRSLLDEWLRLGLVRVDEEERVHLLQEAFIPGEDLADKLYFLGHNLHDHIQAAAENAMGEQAPHFERAVYYNNLTPESVAQLGAYAEAQGMELLKGLNNRARTLQQQDRGQDGAIQRFRFGAYFYHCDQYTEEPGRDE